MNSCYCIAPYFHGAKNFIENNYLEYHILVIFVIIFISNLEFFCLTKIGAIKYSMSQWIYKLFYKASAWSYVPSLSSVGDLAMRCDHGLQLFLKLPEIVPQLLLVVVHVLSYQLFVLIESFLTSETKRSEVD